MINSSEISACLARKSLSKVDGARITEVSPRTFYSWLRKGSMPTDKAEMLITALGIENPVEIFFAGVLRDK